VERNVDDQRMGGFEPDAPLAFRASGIGGSLVPQLYQERHLEPGRGEVRVSLDAITLSRAEVMFSSSAGFLYRPRSFLCTGYEATGVVEAIGSSVDRNLLGARVCTLPLKELESYVHDGRYAIVPAEAAIVYPSQMSAGFAAAYWIPYVIHYGALVERIGLSPETTVLVTGLDTIVDKAAIQIAKVCGAHVVAASDNVSDAIFDEIGVDTVVVTRRDSLGKSIFALSSGKGIGVVVNTVGGRLLEQLAKASSPEAKLIEYGYLSGAPAAFPSLTAVLTTLSTRGYANTSIFQDQERLLRCREDIGRWLDNGSLNTVLDPISIHEKLADALRFLEFDSCAGRVVVGMASG
jgi:NADPH:quinone reductase-like Zn-dependent oxidoreductase